MKGRPHFFPLALVLSLLFSCAGPNSAKLYQDEGKTVHRNLVYFQTKEENLLLDLYLPVSKTGIASQKPKSFPVIVWIHAGAWRWGSKDSVPLMDLTNAGFALVSINYRLDGHAKYPAQIDDCRAALRWLKQNCRKYNLDPNRIGVLGASAGGHLASLLGTTGDHFPALPRIRAVCALYPPTDLFTVVKEEDRTSPLTLVALLLGGPVAEKRELARAGSPIFYVSSGDSPFFLIHGEKDTLVPVEQSLTFHQALRQAGVASTLKVLPEAKHGFYPDQALTAEIIQFFKKNLAP